MKTTMLIAAIVAGFGLTAAQAQDAEGAPRGPQASFAELDANGDGSLTAEDFEALAATRFAAADTDGNGGLSAEELAAQAMAQAQERADARMAERAAGMLERLDANEDGLIQQDEMMARRDGGPGIERMLERFDADEDGALSEAEFEAAQERMAERGGRDDRRGDGRRDGPRNSPRDRG